MNEANVEEQAATPEEEAATQPEETTDAQELPVSLSPEEVPLTYPGFRTPQTEAEIHYELASLDVVIKSLETRKAKLQRDWTHYKLTVHINHAAATGVEPEGGLDE